jgi:hypothetical protein
MRTRPTPHERKQTRPASNERAALRDATEALAQIGSEQKSAARSRRRRRSLYIVLVEAPIGRALVWPGRRCRQSASVCLTCPSSCLGRRNPGTGRSERAPSSPSGILFHEIAHEVHEDLMKRIRPASERTQTHEQTSSRIGVPLKCHSIFIRNFRQTPPKSDGSAGDTDVNIPMRAS